MRNLTRPPTTLRWVAAGVLSALLAGPLAQAQDYYRNPDAAPAQDANKVIGTATAFVVSPGVLVTNEHVVRGHSEVQLVDPTTNNSVTATVVGLDNENDLALLRANVTATPLPIGESVELEERNTPVFLVGYPDPKQYGRELKVAKGRVGLQQAPTNPELFTLLLSAFGGNSGSPVCTYSGQVVGVLKGGIRTPLRVNGVDGEGPPVPGAVRLPLLVRFLKRHHVPYATHAYAGDVNDIIRAVAPSTFLVEVRGTPPTESPP
jgi:S1-C subfamily serine protease